MKKKIIIISIISIFLVAIIATTSVFFINRGSAKTVTFNDDNLEELVDENKTTETNTESSDKSSDSNTNTEETKTEESNIEETKTEEETVALDTYERNYFQYDYKYKTNLLKTPTDGTTPKDYDSKTNIYYALYNLEHKKAFKVITTGTTKANVFFITTEQKIANSRIVIDDKAMLTTISDGIVKIAYQKYFTDNGNNVLMRETKNVENLTPNFEDGKPTNLDAKEYIKKYGWLPYQALGYIICNDTILEASTLKEENGIYEVSLTLDPASEKAPYWYQREVATTGSAEEAPVFSSIKLTYKFDKDWNILELNTQEKYLVKSMGIKTNCETNCIDIFTYENIAFDEAALEYFSKY